MIHQSSFYDIYEPLDLDTEIIRVVLLKARPLEVTVFARKTFIQLQPSHNDFSSCVLGEEREAYRAVSNMWGPPLLSKTV